jgi:tetratricopeptide (TPR) repeat protein
LTFIRSDPRPDETDQPVVSAPRRPDVRALKPQDALDLYLRGRALYFQRNYREALTSLEAAISVTEDDARFWYFKALCELALRDRTAAARSLDQAVALHRQGKPRADQIGLALERIQGPTRTFLRQALENGSPSRVAAR